MTLVERYRAHADALGRTEDVRRFLVGVLVTTRFHLSSRPISGANSRFAERLASSSDALLAVLREPGWPPLDAAVEAGLAALPTLADLPGRRDPADAFRRAYKRCFTAMNPAWSDLAPSPEPGIEGWPAPRRVLLAVGPNIGIGDELIFFELARRAARRWPEAEIEVSSFSPGLWNLCDAVTRRFDPQDDQLAPYVRAIELARRDPAALIVFVEFASTPIYRHLERIAALPRFVCLDTGARTARVIDQARERIAEHGETLEGGMYAILRRLLDRVGLRDGPAEPAWPEMAAPRPRRPQPVVFVNPFSSKDYLALDPGWWSAALRTAADGAPGLQPRVFAGINDACRAYARAVADGCAPAEVVGAGDTPTVEQTLRAALDADVVFGLDTFTAHVGVIAPVPCVTVFFGSAWDPWRVRNNHVLNTHVHATAESAGRLVARLAAQPTGEPRRRAREVEASTRGIAGVASAAEALAAFDRIAEAVAAWSAADARLSDDFTDLPTELVSRARTALTRAARQGAAGPPLERLLRQLSDTWMGSNLLRYARFVAGAPD